MNTSTTNLTHLLVFDMSNMLYKTFYVNTANQNMTKDLLPKLAFHSSFITINKYYKLYKPDHVVFVFDRANWRKDHTMDENTYSKRLYKGHRRKQMTPSQKEIYEIFINFMNEFEQAVRDYTAIICMAGDKLEADDIIAGVCRKYGGKDTADDNGHTETELFDDHCVTIVSADKDMLQLLRYENVQIIDPTTGKNRELPEGEFGTVEYYLYEKYLRGDSGDNIPSAYPRYRTKKIQEAFLDSYKHTNLMNAEWVDADGDTIVVGDVVKENKLLVNLTHQPEHIQELIWKAIDEAMNNRNKYDYFNFLKFLGKNELKNLSNSLEHLMPLLKGHKG